MTAIPTNVADYTNALLENKHRRPRVWKTSPMYRIPMYPIIGHEFGAHQLVGWVFDEAEMRNFAADSVHWMFFHQRLVQMDQLLDDDVLITSPEGTEARTLVTFVKEYREKGSRALVDWTSGLIIGHERTRGHDDPIDWFRHICCHTPLPRVDLRLDIGSRFIQTRFTWKNVVGTEHADQTAVEWPSTKERDGFKFEQRMLLDCRWSAAIITYRRACMMEDLERVLYQTDGKSPELLVHVEYMKDVATNKNPVLIPWYGEAPTQEQRRKMQLYLYLTRTQHDELLEPRCQMLVECANRSPNFGASIAFLKHFGMFSCKKLHSYSGKSHIGPVIVDKNQFVAQTSEVWRIECLHRKTDELMVKLSAMLPEKRVRNLVSPFETGFEHVCDHTDGRMDLRTVPLVCEIPRWPAFNRNLCDIALVLLRIGLPAYCVLWVVDWLPGVDFIARHKKIRVIESVRDSIVKIDEQRERRRLT